LKLARLSAAPLATVKALFGAKVFAAPACNVPALTVVAPLYVLLAVKIVVPVPFCWNAPVPEMSPRKVKTSERLTAKMPLLATLPTIEPLVPPSPSCKVPAEIVVPPVYELSPLRIIVPVPALVSLIVPGASKITPLNVVEELLPPVVSAAGPGPALPTRPSPESEPMLWLKPLRLSAPPATTVNALAGENTLVAPAAKVPSRTLVGPE